MPGQTEKVKEFEKLETENTKCCTKCLKVKQLFEFAIQPNGRKLSSAMCLDCNKEKTILRNCGITLHEYDEMFERQGNKCKICGSEETGTRSQGRFHVDHDHLTGKIRGLLCSRCNHGLGHFKDNIKFLMAAIRYLIDSK